MTDESFQVIWCKGEDLRMDRQEARVLSAEQAEF